MKRIIHVRRGNQLHAFQHLDTALRLLGLGGLCAETINIALQMGDFLLLALKQRLLLRQFRRPLALEGGVVASVFVQRLLLDMQDFIDNRVEEIAVMGDQHQRAGVAFQPLLQPDHRV